MNRALPVALIVVAVALAVTAVPALASPAAPIAVTVVQPDGTTFEVVPFGDEWNNGHQTRDGHTVVRDQATGYWHYAALDGNGRLVPSGRQPGKHQPPASAKGLRSTAQSAPADSPAARATGGAAAADYASGKANGTQKVLVILAQFTNRPAVGTTPAQWYDAFFGAGNSLKNYYTEASYNQFTFVPAETSGTAAVGVVGWVTLPYAHPNTAESTGTANKKIVRDAIIAADPYVNFAAFDANGNHYLSRDELHVMVIVAGYETAYGGGASACSPSVWAHSWSLDSPSNTTSGAPTVDGVTVGSYPQGGGYTQLGEYHCASFDSPGHMATIGTVAHELGHDINWPDLYDISGASEGVGKWSVMGSGNWSSAGGYAGSLPAHPDAFLKSYQGWIAPERITGSQSSVAISQAETNARVVQMLDNPGGVDWAFEQHSGTGEYFLVENRQRTGFDAGLPGCGLLVWHVDESVSRYNDANATVVRPLVDLLEADGLAQLHTGANRGDGGDPYPGTSNKTALNYSTSPNSRLYNGADSGVSVSVTSTGCAGTMYANISAPGASNTPTPNPTPSARPDLVPYAPSGWDYPVVPSSATGTNTVGTLYAGQPTYFDYAYLNQGGAAAAGPFNTCLYLDGVEIRRAQFSSSLDPNYYGYRGDWPYTVTVPGPHTVRLYADCAGAVSESDESNNTWERSFTWLAIATATPTPSPTATATPTVTSTPTATRTPGPPASLVGHLSLQGRSGTAPLPAYSITVTVSLLYPGADSAVVSSTLRTDAAGYFTLTQATAGPWDIRVKGSHTLSRKLSGVALAAGANMMEFTGQLLEGDADDNNQVSIVDFSILRAALNKFEGMEGYDPRADFNLDGGATIIDFSLLRTNFNLAGE